MKTTILGLVCALLAGCSVKVDVDSDLFDPVVAEFESPRLKFVIRDSDPRFQEDFRKAAGQWSTTCGLAFDISTDPAAEGISVRMTLDLDPGVAARWDPDEKLGIRFNSNIQLRRRRVGALAHEIGHALGFKYHGEIHTPGTTGLMASVENEDNSVTADLCQWIQ